MKMRACVLREIGAEMPYVKSTPLAIEEVELDIERVRARMGLRSSVQLNGGGVLDFVLRDVAGQ